RRVEMAGEADEAALARLLGRLERLHRSARSEDAVDILLRAHVVHLPEIEMVGLQGAQRRRKLLLGFRSRLLRRLAGQENVLPDALESDAVRLLGAPAPIGARAIEVPQSEVVHAADVRRGLGDRRVEVHSSAALGDHLDLHSGLAERARRDVARLGLLRPGVRADAGDRAAHEYSALHAGILSTVAFRWYALD